jgi:hypothetical protein
MWYSDDENIWMSFCIKLNVGFYCNLLVDIDTDFEEGVVSIALIYPSTAAIRRLRELHTIPIEECRLVGCYAIWLVTVMMEVLRFSETLFPTRATRCTIPEDSILHSYRRKPPNSYIILIGFVKIWDLNQWNVYTASHPSTRTHTHARAHNSGHMSLVYACCFLYENYNVLFFSV